MSQYTPGPWRIGDVGGTISVVGPNEGDDVISYLSVGGMANARLIASAPALLDELKGLAQALDDVMAHSDLFASRFENHHWQAICDAYDSAQHVIAGAEAA